MGLVVFTSCRLARFLSLPHPSMAPSAATLLRCHGRYARPCSNAPNHGTPPRGHPPILRWFHPAASCLLLRSNDSYFSGRAVTPPASVARGWPASERVRRKPARDLLRSLTARDTSTHIAALDTAPTISAVLSMTGHAAFGLMRLVAGLRGSRPRRRGTAMAV